jgi:glycogen debranching enzyme
VKEADDSLERYQVTCDSRHLKEHAFLLGNRGGFMVCLPATRNIEDRTAQPIKWFGASGFGRTFFEMVVVCVDVGGALIQLDRRRQVEFILDLDRATRVYEINGRVIRESFFVPNGLQALVLTLETDLTCVFKPEFEMRYYQGFNTDFSQYRAERTPRGLLVSNRVQGAGPLKIDLQFYALVGTLDGTETIEMFPESERLVKKTYLKDERRQKLIIDVYKETMSSSPDHAPIWDLYETKVYAPAQFRVPGPVSLLYLFGDAPEEVADDFTRLRAELPSYRRQKREDIRRQMDRGLLETGNRDVDVAYAQVLSCFDNTLVAHDATPHMESMRSDHYYAIFAGNKYFMDAWKRDENISLGALLTINDFESVRCILDNTWQLQDQRTGRLPQIIRVGEPIVYYSSDGTLWALQRLFEYTRDSGDETLLAEKMDMVTAFFAASMGFIQRGLLPSGGIIEKDYLWETWEDTPFTPRTGYPVEIELLWLTVLQELRPFVQRHDEMLAERMAAVLEEGMQTFRELVMDGYLADSLTYDWKQDPILTPNGYIAFGLDYPLPAGIQHSMVLLARDQLAGYRGIRSLAPRDWPNVFPTAFLSDPRNCRGKDMASVGIYNYHRGIEWEWLNPFCLQGELICGSTERGYRQYVRGQVTEALREVGIGGLSELHDMNGQLGADFQAWSMAGFLQSLHLFAGVRVDALAKTVQICPSIPLDWPHLRCRRRVRNIWFDLRYEQPNLTSHRLEVRFLGVPPTDFTCRLGFRVPTGSRVETATCNGEPLSAAAWVYHEGCAADVAGTTSISLPFDRDLVLQVELGFTVQS